MAAGSTLTSGGSTIIRCMVLNRSIKAYTAMERRRAGQEFSSGGLFRSVVGLSNGEIAALRISARTANTLVFRARERVRAVCRQLDPATPQPAQGGTADAS